MPFVCLDIGNVLCRVDFTNLLTDFSEALNITPEEALHFINRSQKMHDLGLTVIRDEIKEQFDVKSPVIINKLLNSWNNCITPSLEVLDTFNHLTANHGLHVALLSNIGIEHAALMETLLSHGGFFQNAIKHFSCEVGARKPTPLFYQSFLMQYPQFHGCVYVDDVIENLEAGKKFGFQTYHFDLYNMDAQAELPEIEKLIMDSMTEVPTSKKLIIAH